MSDDNVKDDAAQGAKGDSGESVMGPPKEIPPPKAVEKEEEAKLRAKYPGLKGPGSNPLLQKRLAKGQPKYFDSGDYAMAKAGVGGKKALPTGQKLFYMGGTETGSAHPTPESIPHRKASLVPSQPQTMPPPQS